MPQQPKTKLTRSQAWFHRHRWARFVLYTLVVVLSLPWGLIQGVVLGVAAFAGRVWGCLRASYRNDFVRALKTYRADIEQWDTIKDNYEEPDRASD